MKSMDFERISFLIVDDNRYMRILVKSVIYAFGARTVIEAVDGADAFKEMLRFTPDVVIVDWNMSPLDGIDFVRLVRCGGDSPNFYVPIVMLSGFTEANRISAARDVGVTEFIAKPVSAQTLYDRLASIFLHPRPFVRSRHYFGPDRRRHHGGEYKGKERRSGQACEVIFPYESDSRYAPACDASSVAAGM